MFCLSTNLMQPEILDSGIPKKQYLGCILTQDVVCGWTMMKQYLKVQIQVPSGNQTSLAGKSMEIPYKWIHMEAFSWKVIQLNGEFPASHIWFTEVTVDEHPSLACLQWFWIVEVFLVGNVFNSTPGKICQIASSDIIGCISSMKNINLSIAVTL